LIAGTSEMIRAGPEFSRTLAARVSRVVLRADVLMMIEEDVPSLRLLILGGEICPADLAARWHRPGRRIMTHMGRPRRPLSRPAAFLSLNGP